MRILAIETSCDETAVAILECAGDETSASFTVLGNALLSQVEQHRAYGGVYPSLAKREHAKNLVPLLEAALEEAELLHEDRQAIGEDMRENIGSILAREETLGESLLAFLEETEAPEVDAIAVTSGPGLEPALWVGISFAKALALLWRKPLYGINHMEGHILSALATSTGDNQLVLRNRDLPILALLISGGHTELVSMNPWLNYRLIGQTLDDAVGEAFDKVGRMLDLPYPGGPEISRLAENARSTPRETDLALPRPMIHSPTCEFSFAGLKTAVMYLLKNRPALKDEERERLAQEFEDAVADVLWSKTERALEMTGARTLVLGGGVSANTHIRRIFTENMRSYPDVALALPSPKLTTDNAIMIGMAGYFRSLQKAEIAPESLRADGNLSLA